MGNFRFVDGHFVHTPFTCSCGREHHVPIREVIVKPGALNEIDIMLDRLDLGKQGLVIADLNTYDAAGEQVLDILRKAGYRIDVSLFNTREVVHPDEYAVGKLIFDLQPGTSFLLVVGSGCLTDTTRVVSSRTGIPFISVATAASMDGYASLGASMQISGMKKTVPTGSPAAILADIDVLCNAPYPMTAAGFGDLLGKLNSRMDWKLTNMVTGEYYCQEIIDLVTESVDTCVSRVRDIRQQTPEAITTLAEGLIVSGIGMLVIGNSRPASGSEHNLSHYWEMMSLLRDHPEHFHGEKVGVGTGVMAKFYERFFVRDPSQIDLSDLYRRQLSREQWEARIRGQFGSSTDSVIALGNWSRQDWDTRKQTIQTVQTLWPQIQELQALEPTCAQVIDILQTAGGSVYPKDVDVDRDFLRETLLFAKEVRTQYTVMSVADALGWLEEIVEEVVAEF
jgi:glycerol-1-phosphate dehydrogenase [NAD(P)+]